MVKTLKNIRRVIPGQSKHLTNLRAKSIKTLKRWENAQKSNYLSRNVELLLKRNAANALAKYADAAVEEEQRKQYIGTARNMSSHSPAPVNEATVIRPLAQSKIRNILNENVWRVGGRRRTIKNRRHK